MEDFDIEKNVTIGKVYPGKEGDFGYGPVKFFNFYLKGDKRKFSWARTEEKPFTPTEGMQVGKIVFKESQEGQYTNYKVSGIDLSEQTQKPPQTAPEATGVPKRDSSVSFYVAYAKDLMVALLTHHAGYNQMELEDLGKIVTQVGMNMQDQVNDKCASCPKAQPNTEPIKMPEQQSNDEQPPIGEAPPL